LLTQVGAATRCTREGGTGVDATFAGNPVAGSEPCAEQVAQLLDCLAAGDVQATIKGLEPVLTHHRRALDSLRTSRPRRCPLPWCSELLLPPG
jgi:hypothetical protein